VSAGVVCPSCAGDTKVINSRARKGQVHRRRECLKCRSRFGTVEITEESLGRLNKLVKLASTFKEAFLEATS